MDKSKTLEKMEDDAREIGRTIGRVLPSGIGFALVVFDFGEGGNMTYVSNARREDMANALKDLVRKLESRPTIRA